MTPVLVFQDGPGKCPVEDLQIKTEKRELGGQVGLLSCQQYPSSTFTHPISPLPITALPFVLPSVIFIAPSLSPSLSLNVRRGHCTPPLPDTSASAFFLPPVVSGEYDAYRGVLCELGQRVSSLPVRMQEGRFQ